MKILIAVGVILIIAAVTNPKKEEHINAVKKVFLSKVMDESIDEISKGSDLEKGVGAVAMTLGMKAIDTMLESIISVDNYVVLSLTRATFKAKTKIIGIGAFGNVFLTKGVENGVFRDQDDDEIDFDGTDEQRFLDKLDSSAVRTN